MRFIPVFLLLSLLAAPAASAVPTLVVERITILDTDGHSLAVVPKASSVRIVVVLNNTGVTAVEETVQVRFSIDALDGEYRVNDTVTKLVNVDPGETVTYTYQWGSAGRVSGDHKITVEVIDSLEGRAERTVSVSSTAVRSGDVSERAINYYWFFAAFILCILLFVVVIGARKS